MSSHPGVIILACLASLLCACGSHPTSAPVARSVQAQTAGTLGNGLPVIDGPVVASTVLAYGGTVARQLDAKAAFIMMLGTKIDQTGAPIDDGSWELSYLGSNVPTPAGKTDNPYNPYTRRITITITADGHAHFRQTSQAGVPLGVSYVEAPNPKVDSMDVFRTFYAQHADMATKAPIGQMSLTGMVSAHHFARLVWRVTPAPDAQPLLLDADNGSVIPFIATPNN